jgi:hypothetical protein
MKMCRGVDALLISALDGGERTACLPRWVGGRVGPLGDQGAVAGREISAPAGNRTLVVQPSRYND